jgi:hypothetical protein
MASLSLDLNQERALDWDINDNPIDWEAIGDDPDRACRCGWIIFIGGSRWRRRAWKHKALNFPFNEKGPVLESFFFLNGPSWSLGVIMSLSFRRASTLALAPKQKKEMVAPAHLDKHTIETLDWAGTGRAWRRSGRQKQEWRDMIEVIVGREVKNGKIMKAER